MRESYEVPEFCERCGMCGCIGECRLMPPDEATLEAQRQEPHPVRTVRLTDAELERRGWFPRSGTYYG